MNTLLTFFGYGDMATSGSGSDDSNKAPDTFNISDPSEDELNRKSKECKLCRAQKQKFVCKQCVTTGNISHSTHHNQEKLYEKQRKYLNIKASSKKCEERCDELLKDRIREEDLKSEIRIKRQRIEILQKKSREARQNLAKLTLHHQELAQQNNSIKSRLPSYKDKVVKLEDYVTDRVRQNEIIRSELAEMRNQFKGVVRVDIQKLLKYIFPIEELLPSLGHSQASQVSAMTAALAEASNTTYIRGKWVVLDNLSNDLHHRIVGPYLPANGNYSAYLDWIAQSKDNPPPSGNDERPPSTHAGYRISAGLTFVTQLTNILSYYLNVRLPYKLAYGDFCRKELTEQQFNRKVAKLNKNIMYLAYTQHVNLSSLNQSHTVTNLMEILNSDRSDLGHMGPTDVSDLPLVKSVDSQVLLDFDPGTESETDAANSDFDVVEELVENTDKSVAQSMNSETMAELERTTKPEATEISLSEIEVIDASDAPLVREIDAILRSRREADDDESSLRNEWESVSHFSQDLAPSTSAGALANPQAASIAGGLVTSAAASIASMFRGWTTNK